jgi:uncharacterized membrane protein
MLTASGSKVVTCALLALTGTSLGNATFQGIGDLKGGDFMSRAEGISANGEYVVGASISGVNIFNNPVVRAVRWSEDSGLTNLGNLNPSAFFPNASARAISDDGTFATGITSTTGNNMAFTWTPDDGMVAIGGIGSPTNFSNGYDVTPDGTQITGTSLAAGFDAGAFVWTEKTGVVGIPMWTAVASSNDGQVIAGYYSNPFRAVVWTQGDEAAVELGSLSGGVQSSAADISGDGRIIVGQAETLPSLQGGNPIGDFVQQGYIWREETGMVPLATLPGSTSDAPQAVNADGSIVVGYSQTPNGNEATIWREGEGVELLSDVLESVYALDLNGWTLQRATGISDDGSAIVGYGINPDGNTEGFIARIPLCQGDLNADGLVSSQDLSVLLFAFGVSDEGDIDGDGDTDSEDLNDLLRAFGCQPGNDS